MTVTRRSLSSSSPPGIRPGLGFEKRPPATSVEAGVVDRLLSQVNAARDNSSYLGQGLARARGALKSARLEARSENWDGYGARPVDPSSYFIASQFIESLAPRNLPTDISVDPDGEVSVNWDFAADRTFSISIGADGRLSYAGRFGPNRVRGVEYFIDSVPVQVVGLVDRVRLHNQ